MWGLSGFADWVCHRVTRIERTSGLWESVMHSVMGLQVGLPIALCVLYEVNVMVLLICFGALVLHEVVAHMDVTSQPEAGDLDLGGARTQLPRHHSVLYVRPHRGAQVGRRHPDGHPRLGRRIRLRGAGRPVGGTGYLPAYLTFMAVVCVFPYIESSGDATAPFGPRRD